MLNQTFNSALKHMEEILLKMYLKEVAFVLESTGTCSASLSQEHLCLSFIIMSHAIISWLSEDCKIIADLSVKVIKFLHVATTYAQLKTRELFKSFFNEYV